MQTSPPMRLEAQALLMLKVVKKTKIRHKPTILKNWQVQKADFAKANFFGLGFLISKAQTVFFSLQKTFTEVLILHHFNPKRHIHIEINASYFTINRVVQQMTLDQLLYKHVTSKNLDSNFSQLKNGQWYAVVYFSRKMILIKTQYETYNQEVLTIVEVFKT